MIRFIRSTALIVLTAASLSAQGFPEIRLVLVADGLESPLLVTHAGDDRLFIVQQTGTILAYEDGSVKETPFLDLSSKIHVASEQGLLGLAFPPDHEENGFFFVQLHERRWQHDRTPVSAKPLAGECLVPGARSSGSILTCLALE